MSTISKIQIKPEDLSQFPSLDRSMICSSSTLNRWFKRIFEGVFKDFVGFRPCYNMQTAEYFLQACFEQKKYEADDITTFKTITKSESSDVDVLLGMYETAASGNHFQLTDEGKSVWKDFIARKMKDGEGNVRWNDLQIVSQLADPNIAYNQGKQYNVINYIDPILLLECLFGKQARVFVDDPEADIPKMEYHDAKYIIEVRGIKPSSSMMPEGPVYDPVIHKPLILKVWQLDGKTMETVADDVGFRYRNNLDIDI